MLHKYVKSLVRELGLEEMKMYSLCHMADLCRTPDILTSSKQEQVLL